MLLPLLGSAWAAEHAWAPARGDDVRTDVRDPLAGPLAAHPEWAPDALPDAPARAAAWTDAPVVPTFHPVAFDYGRRYQELLAAAMGGPTASPVFGPVVAEADVHWRLVDATGTGLPTDADRATAWRDTALAGSVLAATSLLDETLQRAPMLYTLWTIGDTILNPSFDAKKGDEGVVVTHHIGGRAQRRVADQEEALAEPRTMGPPTPSLSAGFDWALRDENAPHDAPLLRYTGWLAGTAVGLTSFRLELSPTNLAWTAAGREQLRPRIFLIGSAASIETGPAPGRLSGGLMWLLPGSSDWNLRLERILSFDDPDARWMLTLRCERRTNIPAQLDPPLGDRGRGGLALPSAPANEGNATRSW